MSLKIQIMQRTEIDQSMLIKVFISDCPLFGFFFYCIPIVQLHHQHCGTMKGPPAPKPYLVICK